MKPFFSVVMPTFNVGQFVEEAIQSLLDQTMPDWELIVVDDQSTDHTLEIVNSMASKDKRIRVYQLPENSGGACTPRNKAISLAEADWIVYLDSDDKIERDYLLKLRRRIEETPDAGLVLTRMVIADSDCNPTRRTYPDPDFDMSKVVEGRSLVKDTLVKWEISFGGIAADKATTLKAIDILKDEPFSSYLDEIMSRHQLILTRKVAFADAKYYYRTNDASITHRPSVKTFDFLINNVRIASILKEHFGTDSEEYELAQAELYIRIFQKLRTLALCRFSEDDRKRALSLIHDGMAALDWPVMKRRLSKPRYLFTRYFPVSTFLWIFKLRLYK